MVPSSARRKYLSFVSCLTIGKLNDFQDFNANSRTPDFDGLLENIERSHKAVIDEHGNGTSLITFYYLNHI